MTRQSAEGRREIVVVHRPAREDWSLPKGKLEPGETFEEAALREVREETGLDCLLGRFVSHTEYRDRKNRPKIVAYWAMDVAGGSFVVNEEVDELRWVELGQAWSLLSYERDRALLIVLETIDEVAPEGGTA